MERLEASADSVELADREAHRIIACWIKHFLGEVQDKLIAEARSFDAPDPALTEASDIMELDHPPPGADDHNILTSDA